MHSLLSCPLDRARLHLTGEVLSCDNGHRWQRRGAAFDFEPGLDQARPFGFWQSWLYDWTLPWLSLPRVFGVGRDDLQSLHDEAAMAAQGGVLVDAPCGTGLLLASAPGLDGVRALVALDLSADMLALARSRLPSALLARADLRALPVADGAATVLLSSLGLQFVPEQGRQLALREIRRTVAPKGLFLDAAPALGLEPRYDRRYQTRKVKDFPLDAERWPAELAAAGFSEVRLSRVGALLVWRAR